MLNRTLYINHEVNLSKSGLFVNNVPQFESMPQDIELKQYLRSIYKDSDLSYPKFHKMDDFCKLGFLTAESLVDCIADRPPGERIGLFLLNTHSSINTDLLFYNTYRPDKESIASPSLFVYTLPNILIGEIAIRHQITGEHAFFLQRDFERECIYLYIKTLFDSDLLDAAVIGGCEVTSWGFYARMAWISLKTTGTLCDANQFNEWINQKL